MLKYIIQAPLSVIYGIVVKIRHKLFDWNILRSCEFDIPIICVGNITVGGTGKTPHTEFLIELLKDSYNVAVLSRGYKRRTKGFVLSTKESSFREIGDEPKQIKLKYPNIPVAVCEKRAIGIELLRKKHPEIELIILDDAFQHRYVKAWVNVLLVDYNRPIYRDYFLPLGRLRDSLAQKDRAHLIVMTKCPDDIKPIDIRMVTKDMQLYPYQSLFFSKFCQGNLEPIFPEVEAAIPTRGQHIIAVAGIANPDTFYAELSQKFNIVKKIRYADHYTYRMKDLAAFSKSLEDAPKDTIIVVTEKDAVKLTNRNKIPLAIQQRLYYAPIKVNFLNGMGKEFNRKFEEYVREARRHYTINKK